MDGEGSKSNDVPRHAPSERDVRLIELFFFAYRDFVHDPDRMLAGDGFGRAHHRVLHFVARNPGITVARLLEILAITKQSLGPVLRELVDTDHLEQRPNRADRRQRLLHVTPKGAALAERLTVLQAERVTGALAAAEARMGPQARPAVEAFLLAMMEPEERSFVHRAA